MKTRSVLSTAPHCALRSAASRAPGLGRGPAARVARRSARRKRGAGVLRALAGLCAWLVLCAAGPVSAAAPRATATAGAPEQGPLLGRPAARVSATYQRWTYPDLTGQQEHQQTQPLQLMAFGDLRNIARRPLRVSFLLRADGDLEDQAVQRVDLLLGYLEALRLGSMVDLRAGRRVPLDGSTTGALDGLWLDLSGLPWLGFGVHAGKPVQLSADADQGEATLPELSLGARAWVHGLPWAHLELRYERQEDSPFSTPLRSRAGGDLAVDILGDWFGFASADHELRSGTLERMRAGLRYRGVGTLRAGVEGFRYDPVFAPGSVFATMESDPHWGLRGSAEWQAARPLALFARWTTRVFRRVEYRSDGQAVLQADPSHAADLGLRWDSGGLLGAELGGGLLSAGSEGAAALAQAQVRVRHQPWGLQSSLGAYLNAHERRFADPSGILELFGDRAGGVQRNLATGGWLELGWSPWSAVSLDLRGELFRDESANRSVRVLARLSGYLY